MRHYVSPFVLAALAFCNLIPAFAAPGADSANAELSNPNPAPMTKMAIESPVKSIWQSGRPVPVDLDLLRAKASPAVLPAKPAMAKVQPGLVKWHGNLNDALAASKVSGKPVLLFQLLGNLDDAYC